MKRLFKGATIITCNENFDIINNGMIAVYGDSLDYVGEYNREFEEQYAADSTIIANNKVLMPGLINAHTHLAMTLFRGYGGSLPLKQWLKEKIWPAESKLTAKDCAIGAQVGISEMLLSGTTCFLDMYFFMDAIAEVVKKTGIRAVLTRGLLSGDDFDEKLEESRSLYENYHNTANNRITVMQAIHAEYTNDEYSIGKSLELAKELDCAMHIHLSETDGEVERCFKRFGVTPVEFFRDIGLFDRPTIAAHCVSLSDDDMKILKEYKVNVVHNPSSNLKLASGFAQIDRMIKAGINVSLGTDGASSNNNLDMMEEMHIAALLAKAVAKDATALDAKSAIRMATINGAKALGLDDEIGSLEKGKRADLIMINQNSPFMLPKNEVCENIVYSANRSNIEMTMVDGCILMERGILRTIKNDDLFNQFEEAVRRIRS